MRPVTLTSRGTKDSNRDFCHFRLFGGAYEFFLDMMGLLSVDQSVVLVVAAIFGMYQFAEGGCSGGRCCQGTDFTCVTTDWRMDRVYGTCYCDERCLKTKDCCFDYPTECPAKEYVLTLRPSKMQRSLFLHCQFGENGSFAVNGCHQNESSNNR